jgi:hypothetical protein
MLVLEHHEFKVLALLRDQLRMYALFNQPTFLHAQDKVRVLGHIAEATGYESHSPPLEGCLNSSYSPIGFIAAVDSSTTTNFTLPEIIRMKVRALNEVFDHKHLS